MSRPSPEEPLVVSADDPGTSEQVVAALWGGGCVVLPTDTVYGLAALPTSAAAVDRLFALKGRPASVPLAVLCADADQALALAAAVPPTVRRVAERLWPGPLTLVLPRRAGLGLHLGEPPDTVGLRCPRHDLVRAVAARVGPIAVTSANRHGERTPDDLDGARESLVGPVDVAVDGGRLAARASTVVSFGADGAWQSLREGPITLDAVRRAAGP